jgi:hypothetical protein
MIAESEDYRGRRVHLTLLLIKVCLPLVCVIRADALRITETTTTSFS